MKQVLNGPMEKFWSRLGSLKTPDKAVAGELNENLDEVLRRIRETGITGGRGD